MNKNMQWTKNKILEFLKIITKHKMLTFIGNAFLNEIHRTVSAIIPFTLVNIMIITNC